MRSTRHRPDLHSPRATLWLAIGLIATTALAALLVMVAGARAQPSGATSLVCPPDDRGQPAPAQLRNGEGTELVLAGATTLTVCRYNGMNAFGGAPQWALRGAGATTDRVQIKRIVAELDALKPSHATIMCPMDDDSDAIATFGYGSAPGVVVTVGTDGCNDITNGHVHRLGLDKPVVSQIEALAKPVTAHKWAAVVGHVRLCGGPAPGRCWTGQGGICAPRCKYANTVTALNSAGRWLAMAQVQKGRFRFTVATSGLLTFELYAGNRLLTKTRKRVTTGRTNTVVMTIPVP